MRPYTQETDQTLARYARDLSLLLEVSTAMSSARSLEQVVQVLAKEMTESVESTFCRIYLLEESGSCLTVCGFYALRNSDLESQMGTKYPIASLRWHGEAISKGHEIVISRHNSDTITLEPEYSLLFRSDIRSVLLMPLVVKETCLGVAALGEMRSGERTPFSKTKIELCHAIASQGALAIENIRAFESIENRNEEIQLILDSVTDGVFSTDRNGRILIFNRAAEKMTGYSANEMIGHMCSLKFLGQDADDCILCDSRCPIQQILQSPGESKSLECSESITRPDGSKISIVHSVAPIFNPSKQVVGTVSVLRDVSREQELIRLKSEFISLVSHQLRTPLAAISASAELLATSNLGKKLEKELLETLNERCKRLNQLANQVLESSRLEKGQVELVLEPLTLVPLIQQTIAVYKEMYTACDIQIQTTEVSSLVLGDQYSVKVILENLLQNALDYSPAGGTVTVSTEESEDQVIITVADQGIGIPPEEIKNIFQQFHRGANQRRQQTHGFGLGLYIAKQLVTAQGGTIWVESQMGQGARFRFTLRKVRE